MGAISGSGLSLGTLYIAIQASVDEAIQGIQRFGSETSKIIDEQKAKWDELKNVGQSFMGVGAALTAGITAPLAGVGAAAVKMSEDLNTARVSFTNMLGSAQAADQMLGNLQKFAAATPFEFPDLVQSARRMQALGFAADQVIPTLTTVGDAAAAMGGGKDVVDRLTLALGQMQAKGKVSAQEMNQIAETGVGAWKILADSIGTSIPNAMKLAEKGLISSSDAIPAILAGMKQKTEGQMAAMSKTLSGQFSNLKDQISQTLIPIGQILTPALQALVKVMSPLLQMVQDFAKWFQGLSDPVKNAAIAFAAMAAALGPIIFTIGGVMTAIGALMPALTAMASFFSLAGPAALGPWGIAIAAVLAGLVALGTWVYQNWGGIQAVLLQAWDGIKTIWEGFSTWVMAWWTPIWSGVVNAWHTIMDPILNFLGTVWDNYKTIWGGVWDGIVALVTGNWSKLAGAWDTIMSGFLGLLNTVWDGIKAAWGLVWDGIIAALNAAWSGLTALWSTLTDPFFQMIGSVWDALGGSWSTAWEGIKSTLSAAWSWLSSGWHSAVDSFLSSLASVWDFLVTAWGAAWGAIAGALASVWGALSAAWHAVMDPFIQTLGTVWDGIQTTMVKVWTAIQSTLTGVWKDLESAGKKAWDNITQYLQTFITWAEKIPGVKQLLEGLKQGMQDGEKASGDLNKKFDEGAQKLGTLTDAFKKGNEAAAKSEEGQGKLNKKTGEAVDLSGKYAGALDGLTKKHAEHEDKLKTLYNSHSLIAAQYSILIERVNKLKDDTAKATMGLIDFDALNKNVDATLDSMVATLTATGMGIADISDVKAPKFITAMGLAKDATGGLDTAMHDLGVKSTLEMQGIADKANELYQKVLNSPLATTWDKNSALLQKLQAERAAMIANETEIPASMDRQIAALKTTLDTKLPTLIDPVEEMKRTITGKMQTLGNDLNKALWEGEGSWGEKGKKLLTDLGEAVTSAFIKPAMTAIGDFIGGAIADLLGGKGLGGIMQSIKDLGSALASIFKMGAQVAGGAASAAGGAASAAGGAASAAGGAASAAGGAGGAAGAAGTALTSVTGIVGAVSGAVSAVSGIVSNFQQAKMETTLNAIEHNTRYGMMYLGERADGGILGILFKIDEELAWGSLTKATEALKDAFVDFAHGALADLDDMKGHLWALDGISDALWQSHDALNKLVDQGVASADRQTSVFDALSQKLDQMLVMGERQINVILAGSDPTQVAMKLATALRAQGALA
jgi:tape measure domain-containing protein